MASDDNDPRRNRDRPDDNPFIAFRRFADSQASSLLNTVFTLPAIITNYKNAHVAREQCLFGRVDKDLCKELQKLEEETAKAVAECRQLYRAGNLEEALEKSSHLADLSHAADLVRKQIVESGRGASFQGAPRWQSSNSNELVEKVANEKGQQWAWSWDWGFPRPFDAEETSTRNDRCRRWHRQQDESATPATSAEKRSDAWAMPPDEQTTRLQRSQRSLGLESQAEFGPDEWIAQLEEMFSLFEKTYGHRNHGIEDYYPIPPRSSLVKDLERAGVRRDAFEDLIRCDNGLPLMPQEKLGQSDHMSHDNWARRFWDQTDRSFVGRPYPRRVPWEGEETAEEPSYEYSHDHEDQHDEPQTPKTKQSSESGDMPETELEAYERLLGPAQTPGLPQASERPSVLSTLTTTEKTIGPDGTMTTKVVLKKRFSDGREESSETVHTQRGHDSDIPEAAAQHRAPEQDRKSGEKKTGWFWSN